MLCELEQIANATPVSPQQPQSPSQVLTAGAKVSTPTAHNDTAMVSSGGPAASHGWAPAPTHASGYGPMGAGPAAAPPLGPAPMQLAPRPPAKSGLGWLWALLGIGAFVVLLGVGAAVLLLSRRASSSSSSGGPSVGTPRGGSARIRDLSGEELKTRLKSRGWEISGESNSTSEAFRMHVFQLSRSGASGTVQLYEYADENMAKLVEDQLKSNQVEGSAMERDGGNVLFVMVVAFGGGTSVSSADLLADVKKP
jgi:hypothetical protein